MEILLWNTAWMLWNLLLAYTSIYLGRLAYQSKKLPEKIAAGILWLLFVPNTIYILTDLFHITYQRDFLSGFEEVLLFAQYVLFIPFGILTFVYSLSYFDKAMKKLKVGRVAALVIVNLLIGVGVMLGRIQRINSWDVFFAPIKTFNAVIETLTFPYFLIPSLLFGVLCNIIYFTYRNAFIKK